MSHAVQRRTLMKGVAWATPAVVVVAAAPAQAASCPPSSVLSSTSEVAWQGSVRFTLTVRIATSPTTVFSSGAVLTLSTTATVTYPEGGQATFATNAGAPSASSANGSFTISSLVFSATRPSDAKKETPQISIPFEITDGSRVCRYTLVVANSIEPAGAGRATTESRVTH